ncbi:50S ribosomal protein L16 [bacterium]|nr:50S ribosomal protein L16 [bacterium]
MAMMPKRVKHRKQQRGRIKGLAHRGNRVINGDFGLQSLDECWLDARVIEAGRVAASRFLGGEGRVFIRVFPHKSVTCIPPETRMGKGKGEPEYWAAVLKPGTVIYEIGGVPEDTAKTAFQRVAHKLPVQTRMIRRRTQ